jgi:hypothetical protein
MMYVLAVIVPPLAILFCGRPFQAVFNAVLWVGSLLFILLPFVAGQLGWIVAVVWAILVVRDQRNEARDRRLIDDAIRENARRPWPPHRL